MVATSCMTAKSDKRLKANSAPQETQEPNPFAHREGSLGWTPRLVKANDKHGKGLHSKMENIES